MFEKIKKVIGCFKSCFRGTKCCFNGSKFCIKKSYNCLTYCR